MPTGISGTRTACGRTRVEPCMKLLRPLLQRESHVAGRRTSHGSSPSQGRRGVRTGVTGVRGNFLSHRCLHSRKFLQPPGTPGSPSNREFFPAIFGVGPIGKRGSDLAHCEAYCTYCDANAGDTVTLACPTSLDACAARGGVTTRFPRVQVSDVFRLRLAAMMQAPAPEAVTCPGYRSPIGRTCAVHGCPVSLHPPSPCLCSMRRCAPGRRRLHSARRSGVWKAVACCADEKC